MMKWNIEALMERFSSFSGLSEEEARRYHGLCQDAAAQVNGMAKESLTEREESLLYGAAAALAFYRWSLLEGARTPESFSSGDIQVKKGASMTEQARKIWEEYRDGAAECVRDTEFVFQRIPQQFVAGWGKGNGRGAV